jgi:hypothetical protein
MTAGAGALYTRPFAIFASAGVTVMRHVTIATALARVRGPVSRLFHGVRDSVS